MARKERGRKKRGKKGKAKKKEGKKRNTFPTGLERKVKKIESPHPGLLKMSVEHIAKVCVVFFCDDTKWMTTYYGYSFNF